MGVPCRGDHAGTLAVAGDLTVGEKSPVSEHRCRGRRGLTVGPDVSDGLFENGNFSFSEMNE